MTFCDCNYVHKSLIGPMLPGPKTGNAKEGWKKPCSSIGNVRVKIYCKADKLGVQPQQLGYHNSLEVKRIITEHAFVLIKKK